MKVRELEGIASLRAINAYHMLMYGLKMLPEYFRESYEEFYAKIDTLTQDEKDGLIKKAIFLIDLKDEEVGALLFWCNDPNGVPFTNANVKNLKPNQIIEALFLVCSEISKIDADLLTEQEKKKLKITA